MTPRRLFIRVFIAMALPFGIVTAFEQQNLTAGLLGGVVFGLFMALIFVAVAVRSGPRGTDLDPRQEVVLSVQADLQAAEKRVLHEFHSMRCKDVRHHGSDLTARTRLSWRSWGERLTVRLVPVDGGLAATIRTEPRWRTTVTDFGKASLNIRQLEGAIRSA